MARSSYVYVVMTNGSPEAAFTVKHELATYLNKRDPMKPPYTIWRLRDGGKEPELTQIIEL
ncbi:hypothetical protein FXV83_16310 [Bradyrhizobium hipponense]|uniref:Uncharacterized protein n=1 Tax=Bradyrhizobium hipponense TaxID=2605638 RepID=A0A5S4YMZ3_9BRAD|nr:hypothetical protein [Bradyrhizobium hipponense]TYO65498.1 hypothetical protein FXV83_16310 [Bradyrhizobium hipponense]